MALSPREKAFRAIDQERARQAERWGGDHEWGRGDCSSSEVGTMTKLAVLVEEVGEVSEAILRRDERQMRRELVQVAAVAVAWLEGAKWGS